MQFLKDVVKKILFHAGYYRVGKTLKSTSEPRLLIVMYHDILPDDQESTAVAQDKPTQSQFAAHVAALRRHFRVLSMEDAIWEIRDHGKLSQPTAVITFDDGYNSVYQYAYPVLKAQNVGATVFILTGWIDREIDPWWLRLKSLSQNLSYSSEFLNKAERFVKEDVIRSMQESPREFQRIFRASLEKQLRGSSDLDAIKLVTELESTFAAHSTDSKQESLAMNWEQIREMAAGGICFGAHTRTHPNLRHVNREMAEKEIVGSRKEVEEKIGRPVVGFAYPYGQELEAYEGLVSMLSANGFTYSCSALPGINDSRSNLFLLRRITLPSTKSAALLGRELILAYHGE